MKKEQQPSALEQHLGQAGQATQEGSASVLSVDSDWSLVSPQGGNSPKSFPDSPKRGEEEENKQDQETRPTMLRRRYTGRLSICQNVVGPDGELVASYEKMHVCDFGVCSESSVFTAAPSNPCTFSVGGVKVGIMICYGEISTHVLSWRLLLSFVRARRLSISRDGQALGDGGRV